MAAPPKPYYTPEEYLARERGAATKSEYLAGEICAMAGASEAHNTIAANIVRQLGNQFEGRPCRVYVSDLRVRVAATGLYTYPDVVAVCGPREFDDDHHDTLLNPTVIFEVLSPTTEAYDRGAKFAHYWRLASLTDYVLVAQDRVRVDHYARQGDGWFVTAASTLDETLRLAAIDGELALAAIYANVEFPALGDGPLP
ncbi:MAG TPA: Uma2 family endonuclease [Chloroflexia bacterium]|nr:Uma2 family endonuclease [Chloroflexia bacterium]